MSDAGFRSTRWSIVLQAGGAGGADARVALETLCGTYWYPLYAFARRRGLGAEESEDGVQGFFADLLARRDLEGLDPTRGRFRAFLLAAFQNFLSVARAREQTLKRGGGRAPLSLDMEGADERYALASGRALEPEALFDRAWALATLDEALARLRAQYDQRGKTDLFAALAHTLTSEEPPDSRAALAGRLGMSEGALKVAVHRLRQRYREELEQTVAGTLEDPAEVRAELARLFEALGGR